MDEIIFKTVIIDDNRIFLNEGFADAIYLRTSGEAVAYLNCCRAGNFVPANVWLDHDLGGADTIMPVVEWLEEEAHNRPESGWLNVFFSVHSQNPVGADTVVRALRRSGYMAIREHLPRCTII